MTAYGSDVDLDRLADFVGGALDGTPDAEDVRHLVSNDAQWAEAYTALVAATATVRDDLAALATPPLQVPDEVAARLDAALRAEAAVRTTGAVMDLGRARDQRKQRRQRWAVGLAAAAAMLVCGGAGVVTSLRDGEILSSTSDAPAGSAGSAGSARKNAEPRQPSAAGAPGAEGPALVVMTGNDYTAGTVGQAAASLTSPAAAAQERGVAPTADGGDRLKDVPEPLRRLGDPAARAACLRAIVQEYGGRVTLVDFARFEGNPAVVVLLDGVRAAAGRRWVVVVGPACGTSGAIVDERFHAAV